MKSMEAAVVHAFAEGGIRRRESHRLEKENSCGCPVSVSSQPASLLLMARPWSVQS